MTENTVTFADIQSAAKMIAPLVLRTPVMTCETINALVGRELFFKCEHLQKVGAFKYRGASHAVARLSAAQKKNGVCTHSSGNHAQALALAAKQQQMPAYILMPETAPRVKVDSVRGYGAEITFCEPTQSAREETARIIVEQTGATFIHPFDNSHVIAGQGTAALELLEDIPDLDAIICPVGGGGLASGTCLAAHGINPDVKIFAAEPEGADDTFRSFQSGERQTVGIPDTIADGLLTSVGELTWPILKQHLSDVLTVDDDQITSAMQLLWSRMKQVVEPSGAVPLAAILNHDLPNDLKKIGVILSGGNIDLNKLTW
ncbi:pyridoxal-phosphate dependent enzyme [Planctomycetaceae bacterium]|nr:pyridoxal-phosphate dependent enzyme [Planctomycetaceae bacterium]MDB4787011.1 pyridoxal-phosphate dependent enzyme [Planctomycetaceae bacterium]